jgi:hypothetical protein
VFYIFASDDTQSEIFSYNFQRVGESKGRAPSIHHPLLFLCVVVRDSSLECVTQQLRVFFFFFFPTLEKCNKCTRKELRNKESYDRRRRRSGSP